MQTVTEALSLLKRQTELEGARRQPGGIRINEEQELHVVRRRLRRPISTLSASDVESWASTEQVA
jgi:hypothetical protein